MRNFELLQEMNKILLTKNLPFQFSSWAALETLSSEDIQMLIDLFATILVEEGIGNDEEVNSYGCMIDDICGKLSHEIVRRSQNTQK